MQKTEPRLTIELVPKSSWYSNARSNVSKEEWDRIRRKAYRAANYRCEICGGVGPEWPVECHEVWDYNDETGVQRLVRMTALCPACHQVKHIGLAGIRGNCIEATQHLADVNGWTYQEATLYIVEQFRIWEQRSSRLWRLDISLLEEDK